jgi:hypothetical protein
MSRTRASVHPSTSQTNTTRGGRRRWIAFGATLIASVAGLTALAASASAHDAPPLGSSSCAAAGTDWQVTNGTTTVENTGGDQWKLTFSTSAGTISPASATGTGDKLGSTGPSYTVTGVPSGTASITVTTNVVWGTPPDYTAGGPAPESTTISQPAGGCSTTVPVPGAPSVTPPTCTAVGTLTVPSNTPSVHWTVAPNYTSGVSTGAFIVTATAQAGYVFNDKNTVENYPVNVAGKLSGAVCDTKTAPVAPTLTSSVCNGAGTHSSPTLTVPSTTGVIYTIKGTNVSGQTLTELPGAVVTVVAKPATGFLFTGAQEVDYVRTFANAGDCLVLTKPVAPVSTSGECTTPGQHSDALLAIPNTPHVVYSINGKDVSGKTLTEALGTKVTLVATPASGYQFAGAQSISKVIKFANVGDCLAAVAVAKPGFSNDQCTAGAPAHSTSYTIPAAKNVSYTVNGSSVAAGTHSATNGSTITVTAVADRGYTLGTSTMSWTHTFAKTPHCSDTAGQTVKQTPTTPGSLASTGVPTSSLVVLGTVVLLLGIGLLLAGGVRGRKPRE